MDTCLKVKEIMKVYNLRSQTELAKKLGISPQLLAYWIKNDSLDIEKIKESFPDLSGDWLLTGDGQMLIGSHNQNSGTIVNSSGGNNFFAGKDTKESELVRQLKGEVEYLRGLVTKLTEK